MADNSYKGFCENLWRQWLDGSLELSPFIQATFQVGYAPEPYLCFDDGSNPLIVLTTNPGAGLDGIQDLNSILSGNSIVQPSNPYSQAAIKFAGYYAEHLPGQARRRIEGLRQLAQLSGCSGVVQIECCPFHSKSLPNKEELVRWSTFDKLLSSYVASLKSYLADKDVFIMSAVGSKNDLAAGSIRLSPWLKWQDDLVGFQLSRAAFKPIVRKGTKTTAALLVDKSAGRSKSLFLMMGGNHLPSRDGLEVMGRSLVDA